MKTPEQWVDDERLAFDDDVIDCDRKEVEVVIRKAQAEAYAAGQEAQHRKTWALAMESVAHIVETHAITQNGKYTKVVDSPPKDSNFERSGQAIRALPCPPIEETKDK